MVVLGPGFDIYLDRSQVDGTLTILETQ